MPLISIVVPCYNVEKYLTQCLKSISDQTITDIEIIAIDDGSSDGTYSLLKEYSKNEKRLKVVHQQNGGYGRAVNRGFLLANGEYIAIVEPDDYIESNMYEALYEHSKKYSLDLCTSGFYVYNSKAQINDQNIKWKNKYENIELLPNDREFSLLEFPNLMMIHASLWTKLFRRDFLLNNNITLDETPNVSYQDFPFYAETLCKAKRIGCVHSYFYHWRVEPSQNSSTTRNDIRLVSMADQCSKVKQIIKNNGLYDVLKEQLYRHFVSANFAFYQKIQYKYKFLYFTKLNNLFSELKNDESIKFIYLTEEQKKLLKAFINNNFFRTISYTDIRRNIISIHLRKNHKKIYLFGKTILDKKIHGISE